MYNRYLFSLVLATLAMVANTTRGEDSEPSRGSQILVQYKQDLQGALRAGLGQGVVEAVTVCRVQAPEIADSLSQDGVRVGRSSHRLRNPDNSPPDWVAPILESYIASPSNRKPANVALGEGRSGYVEPIVLQPLCVACHGEVLAAEVATRINELYPEDRAVGFSVGDLRGVFWVEYPEE